MMMWRNLRQDELRQVHLKWFLLLRSIKDAAAELQQFRNDVSFICSESAEPLLKGRIQGFTASKLGDLLFKDVNMRSMNYSL